MKILSKEVMSKYSLKKTKNVSKGCVMSNAKEVLKTTEREKCPYMHMTDDFEKDVKEYGKETLFMTKCYQVDNWLRRGNGMSHILTEIFDKEQTRAL